MDKINQNNITEEKNKENRIGIEKLYSQEYDNEEKDGAMKILDQLNRAYYRKSQTSPLYNNKTPDDAYIYCRNKAVNYTPDLGSSDDANLSTGFVAEVLIRKKSIDLNLEFIPNMFVRDSKGNKNNEASKLVVDMVDWSLEKEGFWSNTLPLILDESGTHGTGFLFELWEVKNIIIRNASEVSKKKGKSYKVKKDDFNLQNELISNYKVLENIKYQDEVITEREARFIKLDSRYLIEGNPEIENIQNQPFLVVEQVMTEGSAKQLFGDLKYWELAKSNVGNTNLQYIYGWNTLFQEKATRDNNDLYYVDYYFNKDWNRFNIFVNGIMMLPFETPMNIYYPAMNYPVVKFDDEVQAGSSRCKPLPLKLQYISDYRDFILNLFAHYQLKVLNPAINQLGKRTMSRDWNRASSIHKRKYGEDYEIADPDAGSRGEGAITNSFLNSLEKIMESQSYNNTTQGGQNSGDTVGGTVIAQNNQFEKLRSHILSFISAMEQVYLRRWETIQYKYSIPVEDKDGKKVYQDIEYTANDYNLFVKLKELENGITQEQIDDNNDNLFKKSFEDKKKGINTKYYELDPNSMKKWRVSIKGEVSGLKDKGAKLNEFYQRVATEMKLFPNINRELLEEEYINLTGKPKNIFKKLYEAPVDAVSGSPAGNSNDYGNTPTGKVLEKANNNNNLL